MEHSMANPVLTTAAMKAICQGLALGMTREKAAARAGIARRTFYNWLQRGQVEEEGIYREFAEALDEADAQGQAHLLAIIQQATQTTPQGPGSWQAAAWLLERRHGYVRDGRLSVQITGADGGPVEVQAAPSISDVRTFLDKLPPSELRAALERAGDEE
jgi:transposase